MNPDPDTNAHVAGSWWASIAGWVYSIWHWFAGDANGMTLVIGISTVVLTGIKIAQEVHAWHALDEERRVLGKLWDKMAARSRTRPASFDSRLDPP